MKMSIIVKVFREGHRQIAELCKGSTADSDSVCEGSNPSPAAKQKALELHGSRAFCRPLENCAFGGAGIGMCS